MEQSEADPCVFRQVVDGEVTLIVCVHVDGLLIAVTTKDKKTFDAFYAKLKEEFPVNDMAWVIYFGTLDVFSSVTIWKAF